MKQTFNKTIHSKFIKYFKIKENPWKIEKQFYKRTEKYLKYIKWIPWLKMIWIWNSISMNCANKISDIDLYIVTSKKSLWFVRILVTFIFQVLNVRKTEKKHANRFCLSFFSTLEAMDFSSFSLKNDIYLYFWIIYFKPIINFDNTYNLFLEKNKSWADFSEYKDILEKNKKYIKFSWKGNKQNFITFFFNNLFKKIFLNKTKKHFKSIWKPYWILINDNILKFHNWDIRKKIKDKLNWTAP